MERWIAHEGDTPYPRPIQIGGVVRMCQNCLESTPGNPTPVFSTESLVYDPHREQVQCPFCESWDTEPYPVVEELKNGLKYQNQDFWRCKNCGELIYGGE